MECYHTVYTEGTGEIVEKKSRFIAEVFPVSNEEEAFAHLEEIRKKHWDARHHCWAYVIGRNPAAERMSDDGEPAGTAGKPILEVLRGKKLTDVFVVVTRYFGGTLLGTGGLVRAYTEAAKQALAENVIMMGITGYRLKIETDYTGLGKIQYLLGQRGLTILDSVYTEKVDLTVLIPKEEESKLIAEITEATNGQTGIARTGECWFANVDGEMVVFE